MTGTDIVMANGQLAERAILPDIENAKLALREISSSEGLKGFHDAAQLAEIYARAHQSKDAFILAAEVRLWTERRAGEIRRGIPRGPSNKPTFDRQEAHRLRDQGLNRAEIGRRLGVSTSAIYNAEKRGWETAPDVTPCRVFDAELGIRPTVGCLWEKLAAVSSEEFEVILEKIKTLADPSMSTTSVLRHIGETNTRLEPGIYATRDGRLQIRWTKDGVSRKVTLRHGNLERARHHLASVRGTVKPVKRLLRNRTVGDASYFVRMALTTLDQLDESKPEARPYVTEAVRLLHKAEDELVKASLLA